jgi:autotransporter-associated beta strand protein
VVVLVAVQPAQAATTNGTWNVNAAGNWSLNTNWLGNTIATDADGNAYFNAVDITANRTVTVDTLRTIGNLYFADTGTGTAFSWTLARSAANTLTLDRTDATAPIIDVGTMGTGAGVTISCVLAGTDGFQKTGVGQLTLSGTNTFTGTVYLKGGTLSSNITTGHLGAQTNNIEISSGATWLVKERAVTPTRVIIAGTGGGAIEWGSGLSSGINLETDNQLQGSGDLTFTNGGANQQRVLVRGQNTLYNGKITLAYNATSVPMSVSLASNERPGGASATCLPNAKFEVNSGAGTTGYGLQLRFSGAVTQYEIAALSGNANGRVQPGTSTLDGTLYVNQSTNTTYAGEIGDSTTPRKLGLRKGGAGTLELTSAAGLTYTGATAVDGGTLKVTGSIAASSGVTVASGATLKGGGTVPATTVSTGGILAPGGSIGTLSGTNMIFSSGAVYTFEWLNSTGDVMALSGNLTITNDAATTVNASGSGTFPNATGLPLFTYGGTLLSGQANGTVLGWTVTGMPDPGAYVKVADAGGSIVLMPEPATLALLGLGGLGLVLGRKRK